MVLHPYCEPSRTVCNQRSPFGSAPRVLKPDVAISIFGFRSLIQISRETAGGGAFAAVPI